MSVLCLMLLTAAPLPALTDLPAPIGRLDGVLERPAGGTQAGEKIVDVQLAGCDHPVPINVSAFVAGALFGTQQLIEWLKKHPGLAERVYPPGALDEVWSQISRAVAADRRACAALPKDVAAVPKLCAGSAADHAWLTAADQPAALVRWSAASGKDKCLPRVTAVLFDAKGRARVRYDADFGGAAGAALLGDSCQITLTYDAKNEVFHPVARGCKGS